MSAYIPPHLRKKTAAAAAPAKPARRGVRFIGNATGNTNVAANNGTRRGPRSPSAAPRRTTLRVRTMVSPNKAPPAVPTHKIKNLPTKFRNMLVSAGKTKRTRRHKKTTRRRKTTRRVHHK